MTLRKFIIFSRTTKVNKQVLQFKTSFKYLSYDQTLYSYLYDKYRLPFLDNCSTFLSLHNQGFTLIHGLMLLWNSHIFHIMKRIKHLIRFHHQMGWWWLWYCSLFMQEMVYEHHIRYVITRCVKRNKTVSSAQISTFMSTVVKYLIEYLNIYIVRFSVISNKF